MTENINIIQIKADITSKNNYLGLIAELERDIFSESWSKNVLEDMLQNNVNYIFAALWESNVIGYYCAQIIPDEAELNRIAIRKDLRRKGIGNILMEHFHGLCKKKMCNTIYLEVSKHNTAAISLYKENGYETIRIRKDYYGIGDDAIIMMKKIKP